MNERSPEQMDREFGYGDFPEGPVQELVQGESMIMGGCQNDLLPDADPFLRISKYNCQEQIPFGKKLPRQVLLHNVIVHL